MKILIVGQWRWSQYEYTFSKGLESCGVSVSKFSTSDYFLGYIGRIHLTLPIFPGISLFRLNRDLIKHASCVSPDWILFWRVTHIFPYTLKTLRQLGYRTASYNNDDPFGPKKHGNVPWHHHFLWFWYVRCIPYFEKNYFYRKVNCQEAFQYGANHADILLPYFNPRKDRPVDLKLEEQNKFQTDIVFVGHYEPDGREEFVRALFDAEIKVKIWGGQYWTRKVLGDLYERLYPIQTAEGDDYAKALCASKICLAFLSKINRDTYTRRCFEIPACGRLLLAERTDDLMALFDEDVEACYFSSKEELVDKAHWLLENPDIRERIAAAGLRRVWKDGHDVDSRAKKFLINLSNGY